VPSASGGGSKVHASPSKVRRVHEAFIFIPLYCTIRSGACVHQPCQPTAGRDSLRWEWWWDHPTQSKLLRTEAIPCAMLLSHHHHLCHLFLSHCDDWRSDARPPVSCRRARTARSWPPVKCIAWVALPTCLTMRQTSTRAYHPQPLPPQARSAHPISPLMA
jgi:hypothetical protein